MYVTALIIILLVLYAISGVILSRRKYRGACFVFNVSQLAVLVPCVSLLLVEFERIASFPTPYIIGALTIIFTIIICRRGAESYFDLNNYPDQQFKVKEFVVSLVFIFAYLYMYLMIDHSISLGINGGTGIRTPSSMNSAESWIHVHEKMRNISILFILISLLTRRVAMNCKDGRCREYICKYNVIDWLLIILYVIVAW